MAALVSAVLCAFLIMGSQATARQSPLVKAASPSRVLPPHPKRWEKAIALFEKEDRQHPIAKGGVVFIGGSTVRAWRTLRTDFPGLNLLNRGFGGAHMTDCTYYVPRIVWPYSPRVVVIYAGDNDLAAGRTPAQVLNDFLYFVQKVRQGLPEARIVVVSIKPSPARWKIHTKAEEANRLIYSSVVAQPYLSFVDVYDRMLGPKGTPRPELYAKDRLHLSMAGYALWKSALRPYLEEDN